MKLLRPGTHGFHTQAYNANFGVKYGHVQVILSEL